MIIKNGMYCIEEWSENNISFKQFRMAVLIEDEWGYTDLVTTAIVMQVDNDGKGYATHIEGKRYFDSFGNPKQEWLHNKLLHDYDIYIRASRKKIERISGAMSSNMSTLIDKFLEHKIKLTFGINWSYCYTNMDIEREEEQCQ